MARHPAQAPVLADAGGGLIVVFRGDLGGVSGAGAGVAEHGGDYPGRQSAPTVDSRCGGAAAWLDPETPLHVLQGLLASEPAALRERVLANLVNDPKLNGPGVPDPRP
jgi:hypothetical protein